MPKFVLTPPAEESLIEISKYTKENWGVDKQKKYMKSFYECFNRIALSPSIGKKRDEISKGLRSYNSQKHVIFYRIDNDNIIILNILHEKMHSDKWL